MRDNVLLPDLSFPLVRFGFKETPWNLNILLFNGGGRARADLVGALVARGELGKPQFDRLELLEKFHEQISEGLSGGGARDTAFSQFRYLRSFYDFADRAKHMLTVETVVNTYCIWADVLFHRTRIAATHSQALNKGQRSLSMRSAYIYAASVGTLLDRALERHTSVIEMTRIVWRRRRQSPVGIEAEKQNLGDTFTFGNLLQDICDGLPLQTVVESPLPVTILMRNGNVLTRTGDNGWLPRVGHESTLRERYPIANLRIEAELLMFIGQTGMNLTQASNLALRHFTYVSHLDGYQVKDYKRRSGGVVLFEIFKDYRPHFERYLAWRRTLFPKSALLFPFVRHLGTRTDSRVGGERIRAICKGLDLTFISPRLLRNTRINWLLRKSADPDLTAEMAQHTKKTLIKVYSKPSLQRALVEGTRFWSKFDPHAVKTESVAPGDCTSSPKATADIPRNAPKPDCAKPSGCLWCENHRDVDSLDYVWALASFCNLKVIELSMSPLPLRDSQQAPAQAVIERIHEKLRWFEQSNKTRRSWTEEAHARVTEGDYHPSFRTEIVELEGEM